MLHPGLVFLKGTTSPKSGMQEDVCIAKVGAEPHSVPALPASQTGRGQHHDDSEVTLVGKFRVRLTEPPHLHEDHSCFLE